MTTVEEIIVEYLKKNGYDGLAGDECGCGIDDIEPCGAMFIANCAAGYKMTCSCGAGCAPVFFTKKLTCKEQPHD